MTPGRRDACPTTTPGLRDACRTRSIGVCAIRSSQNRRRLPGWRRPLRPAGRRTVGGAASHCGWHGRLRCWPHSATAAIVYERPVDLATGRTARVRALRGLRQRRPDRVGAGRLGVGVGAGRPRRTGRRMAVASCSWKENSDDADGPTLRARSVGVQLAGGGAGPASARQASVARPQGDGAGGCLQGAGRRRRDQRDRRSRGDDAGGHPRAERDGADGAHHDLREHRVPLDRRRRRDHRETGGGCPHSRRR